MVSWGSSSADDFTGADASVDDMTADSTGDGYGWYNEGVVDKESGVGASGCSEKLFRRKVVGVFNGDGQSGSILKLALSDVRNAVIID